MEDWQMVFAIVVPVLAVLVPFLIHIKNTNRDAHDQIGRNFNTRLDDFKTFFNERFNDLHKRFDDLRDDRRGRPSGSGQG